MVPENLWEFSFTVALLQESKKTIILDDML